MASKSESGVAPAWLVTRRFKVHRANSEEEVPLFIALGFPRKLRKSEKSSLLVNHDYGCEVQTGRAFTRHVVYGQDALSAIAHAVLALEKFLLSVCEENAVYDEHGRRFEPATDLVLLGTIGRRYLQGKKRVNGSKLE
jgi:hypothetical protein